MKKLIIAALLFGGALSLFAQQGIIKEVNGTVELKPAGTAVFVPAKAGDQVAPNTIVSTGFRSSALITVGSATLMVRPVTLLSLTEISQVQGIEKINVNIQTGRLRAELKPPAGMKADMTVKGPTATASVRGTAFEFDTLTVRVAEGTVAYSGNGGDTMLVDAGASSEMDPVMGRPADPVEMSAANLLPPAPVGAGTGAGSSGVAKVEFTLTITY
jgi:hypothetical protein